ELVDSGELLIGRVVGGGAGFAGDRVAGRGAVPGPVVVVAGRVVRRRGDPVGDSLGADTAEVVERSCRAGRGGGDAVACPVEVVVDGATDLRAEAGDGRSGGADHAVALVVVERGGLGASVLDRELVADRVVGGVDRRRDRAPTRRRVARQLCLGGVADGVVG